MLLLVRLLLLALARREHKRSGGSSDGGSKVVSECRRPGTEGASSFDFHVRKCFHRAFGVAASSSSSSSSSPPTSAAAGPVPQQPRRQPPRQEQQPPEGAKISYPVKPYQLTAATTTDRMQKVAIWLQTSVRPIDASRDSRGAHPASALFVTAAVTIDLDVRSLRGRSFAPARWPPRRIQGNQTPKSKVTRVEIPRKFSVHCGLSQHWQLEYARIFTTGPGVGDNR